MRGRTAVRVAQRVAEGLAEVGGAVEVEYGAAGPFGLVGSEVEHRCGDLLWLSHPPERALGPDLIAARWLEALIGQVGGDESRRYGGDRDAVRGERAGQRLAKRVEAGLARSVGRRV